jgi:acetyltransferase-like isoleucine patch superfamily enzyme
MNIIKFLKVSLMKAMQFIIWLVFNRIVRKAIAYVKTILNIFYSYYIGAEFTHIEDGYTFEYPFLLKGGKYIKIGKCFSTRARFRLEAWDSYLNYTYTPQITIGDNVIFNFDCHIGAINRIDIGNNVLIGSRVLITDHNHGQVSEDELEMPPSFKKLYSKGPVVIEDNVWIGEGVAILPGVRIGRNAVIGANSVVSSDVPENCVAGGIPAKVIKQL